ncbi:MAG: Ig-like domain-containing protein, partial [Planctomycetaceae bacterium]|nr:Ig-like domain-containing protein [Planctomycetaceae bacterium]
MRYWRLIAFTALLSSPALMASDEEAPPPGPAAIQAEPAVVQLHGPRALQLLVVTGQWTESDLRDVTPSVTWESSDPAVVTVTDGVLHATGNGTATVTARQGDLVSTVQVAVQNFEQPAPITFYTEVLGSLTKAGCNMGACHGSPSGKGGFRLSLRGYDPPLDLLTLRREFGGRRVNLMEPDASLLLKKPLMEVAHGGGQRLHRGDAAHTA